MAFTDVEMRMIIRILEKCCVLERCCVVLLLSLLCFRMKVVYEKLCVKLNNRKLVTTELCKTPKYLLTNFKQDLRTMSSDVSVNAIFDSKQKLQASLVILTATTTKDFRISKIGELLQMFANLYKNTKT